MLSILLFLTHHRQAFKLFDLDGDGVVSMAELRKVLTRAGAHRVTDTEARQMVEMADSDGNEVLDYSEFEQLWNQIRADTEVSVWWWQAHHFTSFHRMKRKSGKNFSN